MLRIHRILMILVGFTGVYRASRRFRVLFLNVL